MKARFELMASRQSHKLLKGEIAAVETFNDIDCCVIFYDDFKVLIPVTQMEIQRERAQLDKQVGNIQQLSESESQRKVLRGMIGATIYFVVKEINVNVKIAAASRHEAMMIRRNLILGNRKIGDILMADVTSVNKNYCIVDCGGIATSVSKGDVDYGYIDNIDKYVQVGDRVLAKIQEINLKKNYIKVSMKEAKEDPYDKLVKSIKVKGEYRGTVTGIKDYGVFLTIRKGLNCLCPFPNWSNFLPSLGEKYVVQIKKIDAKNRKINATFKRTINQNL